jgi:hypothetical protein
MLRKKKKIWILNAWVLMISPSSFTLESIWHSLNIAARNCLEAKNFGVFITHWWLRTGKVSSKSVTPNAQDWSFFSYIDFQDFQNYILYDKVHMLNFNSTWAIMPRCSTTRTIPNHPQLCKIACLCFQFRNYSNHRNLFFVSPKEENTRLQECVLQFFLK